MSLTAGLKRAPKWAWVTAGGLAVGGTALKLWKDRGKPAEEDGPATGDVSGGIPVVGGGGATGVIVPPIVMPSGGDEGASNLVPLMDLFTGVVGGQMQAWNDVTGAWEQVAGGWSDVYGPIADLLPSLITAGAGGPPVINPSTHVVVNMPAPAPPAAPKPTSHPAGCPSSFPLRNPSNGKCYKKCGSCARDSHGKKYRNHDHCYQDGSKAHISNEYPGGC